MPTTTGIRAGAAGSDGRLSLVPEAVWGTTPATPAFINTRFTSENLMPSKQTVRSDEIRPDRNIADEIMVGRSVAGDLNFELSYGTFDELLESLMSAEWATNKIKNGAGLGRSFTGERRITKPDGTFDYHRFTGLVANTLNLNITAKQLVTGSFGMMGKFGGRGSSIITGATYADANQNRPLNASSHVSSLTVAGVPASPVRSLSLQVTNNLRMQEAVGSLDTIGFGRGRFEVTGSMEALFDSGDAFQAFLDHTDLGLQFTLGTTAGSRYRFSVPTIVLTGDPGGNISSNDDEVLMNLNFTGVLDRLSGTPIGATLQVERGI